MDKSFTIKNLSRPASLVGILAAMALILAACAPAAATTPAQTPPSASSSSLSIDVATDPSLGQYLVDNNGFTLYISTNDMADTSSCDATCQQNWPPLVSSSVPKVGPGVNASLISLATLSNGEKIVTYDKRPLYYKLTDKVAGQITGEDVNNAWFVVSPAGQPVETASITAPIPTPTTSQPTPGATAASTPAATPLAVVEPTISVAKDAALGNILVGGNGLTLYAFAQDPPDKSNCNAACQQIWPPVYTLGNPHIANGVDASKVGYITLSSGNQVVTYNHMPLYYFINDTAAGQTNGQGFDNAWFAVSPSGNMVGSVSEVTINVAYNPTLGSYLVDGKGLPLYLYTKDTPDTSTCSGVCAAIWPPVLTLGKPTLGPGVDQSMIGTAKLADGSLIVTYNHIPLYYFVGDGMPDQVLGQGFKNVWYVIGPDGKPITTPLSTPPASVSTINIANSPTLGQYLVNSAGMTLYAFSNDQPGKSNCTGTCLTKWPPLLSQGTATAGSGVDAALVGSALLADGTQIVTYKDIPLYTFAGDTKPGDTTGQGIGGLWYVISPTGQVINK